MIELTFLLFFEVQKDLFCKNSHFTTCNLCENWPFYTVTKKAIFWNSTKEVADFKNWVLTQFQQPNGQSWVPCLKQGNLLVVILPRGGGGSGVRRFT